MIFIRIENQKVTINNKVRAIEQKLMLDPKVKQTLGKEFFAVFTSFLIFLLISSSWFLVNSL